MPAGETRAICAVCSTEFVYRRATKPRTRCDEHWSGARRVRKTICWDDHIEEAKQMYASGLSCNSIAKSLGGYHGALAKALKRAGVTLRDRYATKGLQLPSPRKSQVPKSAKAIARGGNDDQAERIHHREVIIKSLTRVVRQTTDAALIERAKWIMEDKEAEIASILAETPQSPGAGQ